MLSKIILASPRGPCAGVNRALEIVELALQKYGAPIYVNHQIVHNNFVVRSFEHRGVKFSSEPEDIPEGSVYIFSAHGVSPEFRVAVERKNLQIIDATCPLVTKVHREAKKYAEENAIIFFIGHAGHPEVLGTTGVTNMILIENLEQAQQIQPDTFTSSGKGERKVVVLTQTTLSFDDTEEIILELKKKFPHLEMPKGKDICYATQNRQNAVKKLAKKSDYVFVVGSPSSSNSNRLVETAKKYGADAELLENSDCISLEKLEHIDTLGITSGASVPEVLVFGVLDILQHKYPQVQVETLKTVEENVEFVLPQI